MVVLIPLGVMNIAAMAGLAVLIFLEKLWYRGTQPARVMGAPAHWRAPTSPAPRSTERSSTATSPASPERDTCPALPGFGSAGSAQPVCRGGAQRSLRRLRT
ncbi:copper chaperone [Kitasatospora sp. McL0602]|uniref:copper chaperone n=1 Tax=Kitasatospora sp. McL0602 TaxID=3439530 RepID=UPI003F888341